jgi:hypothetical protein
MLGTMDRVAQGLRVALIWAAVLPAVGYSQTAPQMRLADRVRLAETIHLADRLCDRVWPGWGRTPLQLLLVTDSAEFLVGSHGATPEFAPLGTDALLGQEVWTRPRRFPPTLLATFPAVAGKPTIVIGSAERTGKSSTEWVLTVLHEHFHQWQYSQPDYYPGVARLDLARGDTTGQWMLHYPFPYDSAPVRLAMRHLAKSLRRAMDAPAASRAERLQAVIRARDTLRSILSTADYRYFEFQLWQEGVARFVEYAMARAAAASYDRAAEGVLSGIRRELDRLELEAQRRVAFYPIGAAMALLLEQSRPDWKRDYLRRPFALAVLLSSDR